MYQATKQQLSNSERVKNECSYPLSAVYILCNIHNWKQISNQHFHFSPFNCCLNVVLSLEERIYPENVCIVYYHIKQAFFGPFVCLICEWWHSFRFLEGVHPKWVQWVTTQLVLGGSCGVVNSLDFCLALLKSLCFYFWCILSSHICLRSNAEITWSLHEMTV